MLDFGDIENSIAFHLSIADGLSLQTFLKLVGNQARNARYIILSLIRQNPGVTLVELTQTHFRDKSSMSPLITQFVAAGTVRREKIYRGGRPAQALFLTPAGEALLSELHPLAELHTARVLSILGEEDRDRLVALLRKLSDGLHMFEGELDARTQIAR